MSDIVREHLDPYLARMAPLLEATLDRLGTAKFRIDPIGGPRYSRVTSIMSSAYKRHGQILGRAILERLKDCSRFLVWTEDCFLLSPGSREALARGLPPAAYRDIQLPYGESDRSIPVDLIVHEPSAKRIRAYNVTRGNGVYDAAKKRLMVGEMLRTQIHLAGYAHSLGIKVATAEAYIVSYYGLRVAPESYSLVAAELDAHFDFPVMDAVEAVNDHLRKGLHRLVEHNASTPTESDSSQLERDRQAGLVGEATDICR